MKNRHATIPVPLQAQILIRAALALLSLSMGIVLLAFFSLNAALPLLIFALLAAISAARVYLVAASGHYIAITGTVLKVERTAFLRRAKALLLAVDGKALRVVLRSRRSSPHTAERVTVYIHDSTPIHEWKGLHLLGTYLALTGCGSPSDGM